MKNLLFIAPLALMLCGCGSSMSSTEQVVALRKQTEKDMIPLMTAEVQKKFPQYHCTAVSLVEQTPAGQYPQIYTGFATFSNGEKLVVKVTVGQDQNAIYELNQ